MSKEEQIKTLVGRLQEQHTHCVTLHKDLFFAIDQQRLWTTNYSGSGSFLLESNKKVLRVTEILKSAEDTFSRMVSDLQALTGPSLFSGKICDNLAENSAK